MFIPFYFEFFRSHENGEGHKQHGNRIAQRCVLFGAWEAEFAEQHVQVQGDRGRSATKTVPTRVSQRLPPWRSPEKVRIFLILSLTLIIAKTLSSRFRFSSGFLKLKLFNWTQGEEQERRSTAEGEAGENRP